MMKIHLCNPIGVSFGFSEIEIPRLAGFLKAKKFLVSVYDLRINVIARLQEFFLPSSSFIRADFEDISRQFYSLPENIKILQRRNSRLLARYLSEERNHKMQEYLWRIAQLKSPIFFNRKYTPKNDISRKRLLQIERLIDEEIHTWIRKIIMEDPELIGFSILPRKIYELLENKIKHPENYPLLELIWSVILARKIKKKVKVPIWIGCSYPRSFVFRFTKQIFEREKVIDFIIYEDYEETVLEYIDRFKNNADLFSIPGAIVKIKNRAICNPSRGRIKPLDKLPYPDYSEIPLDLYKKIFGDKTISIQGSVGCSEHCSFCSSGIYRNEYIKRSPEHIAREMITLKKKFDIDLFMFEDRLININTKDLEKLCELLISSGLDIRWGGYAKISPSVSKRLLKKMYTAGCRLLLYGIESGSPDILKKMKKDFTLKLASRVLKDTAQSNISTTVQIMTDFPGEGEKEFTETINFVKRNLSFINHLRINRFSVYPGSDIAEHPQKYGLFFYRGKYKPFTKSKFSHNDHLSKFIDICKKMEKDNKNYFPTKYIWNKQTRKLIILSNAKWLKLIKFFTEDSNAAYNKNRVRYSLSKNRGEK